MAEIDKALDVLTNFSVRPSGTVRITATQYAARSILWPRLQAVLAAFPDISLEIDIDYGLTDILAERFDAGVRPGDIVGKDMVAVRIGPDMRMAMVGSPAYFEEHRAPQAPGDLTKHPCINLRLPSRGALYAWEFEKGGETVDVRVEGRLTFTDTTMIIDAAVQGFGLAFLPEGQVGEHIADGRLVRCLEDWCEPYPGYHLFYPNRRHHTAAFSVVLSALRL